MRFANLDGRASIIVEECAIDVEEASKGQFSADPMAIYSCWKKFHSWADEEGIRAQARPFDRNMLYAPSPVPRQIFAVGLNYMDHAMESGIKEKPTSPAVFTKFQTCLSGPETRLKLPSANVDWEVELVVTIGTEADKVGTANALDHIAGLSVGQDYSERVVQTAGAMPQFSLGKSFSGFGPIGPWLVTLDALKDPNDLTIDCTINGVVMQSSRTSNSSFRYPSL